MPNPNSPKSQPEQSNSAIATEENNKKKKQNEEAALSVALAADAANKTNRQQMIDFLTRFTQEKGYTKDAEGNWTKPNSANAVDPDKPKHSKITIQEDGSFIFTPATPEDLNEFLEELEKWPLFPASVNIDFLGDDLNAHTEILDALKKRAAVNPAWNDVAFKFQNKNFTLTELLDKLNAGSTTLAVQPTTMEPTDNTGPSTPMGTNASRSVPTLTQTTSAVARELDPDPNASRTPTASR